MSLDGYWVGESCLAELGRGSWQGREGEKWNLTKRI